MRDYLWMVLSGVVMVCLLSGWTSGRVEAAPASSTPMRLVETPSTPLVGRVTLSPGGVWTSPGLPSRLDQDVTIAIVMDSGSAILEAPAARIGPIRVTRQWSVRRHCTGEPITLRVIGDPSSAIPVTFRWQLISSR